MNDDPAQPEIDPTPAIQSLEAFATLEDYLAMDFPHFRLRPARIIGIWLSCELSEKLQLIERQSAGSLSIAISGLWNVQSESKIKAAQEILSLCGEDDFTFWIAAEHIKVMTILLTSALVVNPIPIEISLTDSINRSENVRVALLQRACDVVSWITERPIFKFKEMGFNQVEFTEICQSFKQNPESKGIDLLTEFTLKAEELSIARRSIWQKAEYLSSLEFLFEKTGNRKTAAQDKDAFDKRIERSLNKPADYKIDGSAAKKGTPWRPTRYLRSFLESIYRKW